jgi:toxin ParE1/3/4
VSDLIISPEAESDLDSIAAYIARDNPDRAFTFIMEIRARFLDIAERPHSFAERLHWRKGKRSALVGRYHIVFEIKPAHIEIQRVLHGARDIPDIL